jgi:hypothetical protein
MQTAEHRSDDNRLAQVVMPNSRRHALPDPVLSQYPIGEKGRKSRWLGAVPVVAKGTERCCPSPGGYPRRLFPDGGGDERQWA